MKKNNDILLAIADDHPVVRLGIRTLLENNARIKIAAEYSAAAPLMRDFADADWEVLILDVDLKDHNGVELTKQMLLVRPELKILILSIYPEKKYALRAMKAGAKGYVNKNSVLDNLEEAVIQVAGGQLYVSKLLSQLLAEQALFKNNIEDSHAMLSDRELQVLCLYGDGKSNQEIAEQLYISIKTVSTYRRRILDKMNLKSTADLISYAITHDLVT